MTSKNTAYARMLRERKPKRGAAHTLMEDLADGLFRGPAKTDHGIDLVVTAAAAERLTQGKLLSQLPDAAVPHLVSRLGADEPATGILVFDGVMTDALIEQQTLGRVSAAPRIERAVTAIDAALSCGFATSVIAKLGELTEDMSIAKDLQGYTSGRPQIDRPALSLALSSKHYDVLRVELDLGPGLKRATVHLAVPASVALEIEASKKPKINPDMVEVVQDAGLRLDVHLPPIKLPLKTLISLAPDTVIPLTTEALSQARIVDTAGRKFTTAKLGQFKGKRAVRLNGQFAKPVLPFDPSPPSANDLEQPVAASPDPVGVRAEAADMSQTATSEEIIGLADELLADA